MQAETHERRMFQKYHNILLCENLLCNDVEYKKKDVKLDEIGYLLNNLESFVSSFPNTSSRSQAISKLSELTVGLGLVHKYVTEDRDFGAEDFPYTAENALKCFEFLKILINEVKNLEDAHKRQFLINTLLLCATHSKSNHWTSEASIHMSIEFLEELLCCTGHQNVSNLLIDDNFQPTVFKGFLKKMRPALMKDTWMLNPSSCYVFSWFLHSVKHPYLVDYLPDVFPPPFMFTSYFGPSQQVVGIQCFDHIMDNVPQTLIKLDGKEDAIYHTLFPMTYSKEPCIVSVLFPCLLKLPMMRTQKSKPVSWREFDKILNNLLFTVAVENNIVLKRILLGHVLAFCECTPPFKHLKRIMNIVKQTIIDSVSPDTASQIIALQILKSIIRSCWPRMSNYCFEIIVLILELLEDEEHSPNSNKFSKTHQLCEECLILLKHACSEKFLSLTVNYTEDCPDFPGAKFLRNLVAE